MIFVFKQCIKRKLIITSLALLLLIITLTFPKATEDIENITITYQKKNEFPIFLVNEDDFVSRTTVVLKNEEILEEVKEIVLYLTEQSSKSAYLPVYFNPILPSGTKLLSLDLQDGILKLNFNKKILDIKEKDSRKMMECLVYSLTELEDVKGLIVYVEDDLLRVFPNTNEKIPDVLTRDIGVNKLYNLNSFKNVSKTTVYYISQKEDITYFIPVTILENNEKDKIEIVIEHLKTNPYAKTNLISYLKASTELSHYEILEQTVYLSFSPLLYEGISKEDMLETVKFSIALSLKDTLNVQNVVFTEN